MVLAKRRLVHAVACTSSRVRFLQYTCDSVSSRCAAHTSEAAAPVLRSGRVKRETKETKVDVTISIDGTGRCKAQTPIHFLNHMLDVGTMYMFEYAN